MAKKLAENSVFAHEMVERDSQLVHIKGWSMFLKFIVSELPQDLNYKTSEFCFIGNVTSSTGGTRETSSLWKNPSIH